MNLQKSLLKCVKLLQRGETGEAIKRANRIIKSHPQLGMGYLLRGRALLAENRSAEAVQTLSQAVAKDPKSAEGHVSLAMALQAEGKVKETMEAFIRALEIDPESAAIKSRAGDFMLEQGLLDDAENFYRQAALQGDINAINGLVMLLERKGDFDGALHLLDTQREHIQHSVPLNYSYAKLLHRKKRHSEALDILRSVDEEKLIPSIAVTYYHLLGDVLHEFEDPEQAFAAYLKANTLRNITYDAKASEERIDGIIANYRTKETFAQLPTADNDSDLPIFIIGMPRSGTSLVEQVVACHPAVYGAGELDDLISLAQDMDTTSFADLKRVAETYLSRLRAPAPDVRHVTDKMLHNFLYLGVIAQLFPKSRIIYCRRNPLDTGFSCFRRNFHATHDYATDLWAIGHFMKQLERLMEHWHTVLPLPILEVNYEDFVTDLRHNAAKLLDFCNLPWDEAVLSFHESGRVVSTASYHQVSQPVYKTAIGYSARYEKFLEPFKKGLEN